MLCPGALSTNNKTSTRGFNLSVPVAFVHKEIVTLKTCLIILTYSIILTYFAILS